MWLEASDQLVLLIILPNIALNFLCVCRDPSSLGMSDNCGVFGRKPYCYVCVTVDPLTLPFCLLKCFCLSSFLTSICSAVVPAKYKIVFVTRLSDVKPEACVPLIFIFDILHFKCQVSAAVRAPSNLNAHCRTVFCLPVQRAVDIMGQCCVVCQLKGET